MRLLRRHQQGEFLSISPEGRIWTWKAVSQLTTTISSIGSTATSKVQTRGLCGDMGFTRQENILVKWPLLANVQGLFNKTEGEHPTHEPCAFCLLIIWGQDDSSDLELATEHLIKS